MPSGPCAAASFALESRPNPNQLPLSLASFRVGVLLTRGESSPPVVAKSGYIGDGTGACL